jgi:transposase
VLRPRQQEKLARGAKDEEHAMSNKLNSAIAVIGIDIGKNSFHVVGHDKRGAIMLRQKWSRGQVQARLANLPPCLIGMEACVGAHHLSRKLQMLGHDARLMPAKYVRPYSKGQKNDFRDAEAITEAVQRPTMKFVATKTAEQLDLQALHRVRDRLAARLRGMSASLRLRRNCCITEIRRLVPVPDIDASQRRVPLGWRMVYLALKLPPGTWRLLVGRVAPVPSAGEFECRKRSDCAAVRKSRHSSESTAPSVVN